MLRETRACAAALLLYGAFYSAFFLKSLLSGNYIAPSDSLDFGVAAFLSSPALWTQGMYSGYPIVRLWLEPTSIWWGGGVTVISLLAWSAGIVNSGVRRRRDRLDPRKMIRTE